MTTIGLDFASVDHNTNIDFAAAKHAGARFAFPRAIYGRPVDGGKTPFVDPMWRMHKDSIVRAGLKRSAYLFICYPKKGVYTPSPEEQAQAFIDYVQLDPCKDLVPFVDVEEDSGADAQTIYEWTVTIVQAMRVHYDAWPGIYTSARVWAEILDHHAPGELLNCPLWLAKPWPWHERTDVHLDGAPGYSPTTIPEFGNAWMLYQYQGDAIGWPGFNSTVDADRVRVYGKGSRGQQVVWTQKRLGITADGIYGDQTAAAVAALQKRAGIAADGIVGLDTLCVLCWQNP